MRFWRSFYDLVIEVYRRFSDDDGAYLAASISYYALFSIFPLLLLAISIAGYLFASRGSEAILAYTDQAIPQFTAAVKSNIEAVAMNRQSTGLIGALTLLWTGSMVFDAIGFTKRLCCDGEPSIEYCFEYIGPVSEPISGSYPECDLQGDSECVTESERCLDRRGLCDAFLDRGQRSLCVIRLESR